MKGGGDWEEYCPVCGLPFGPGYETHHGYNWMTHAYGFETGNETSHDVYELGDYDYGGYMNIYSKRNSNNNNSNNNNNNNNDNNMDNMFNIVTSGDDPTDASKRYGIAVHKDCVHAIETSIGRKLTYKDVIPFRQIKQEDLLGHDQQWFEWDLAKEDLPYWILESPLRNDNSHNRILTKVGIKPKKVYWLKGEEENNSIGETIEEGDVLAILHPKHQDQRIVIQKANGTSTNGWKYLQTHMMNPMTRERVNLTKLNKRTVISGPTINSTNGGKYTRKARKPKKATKTTKATKATRAKKARKTRSRR